MNRIRTIPVLLLLEDGLYKTIKFKNPQYIGDPINAVKIFNEKEADEIILLNISATKNKQPPNFKKLAEIASEAFMPMGYGGGIRSFEDAKKVFDSGYEKIILNTYAFLHPKLIQQIASVYGSQSIVVSIDAKLNMFGQYKVYICDGTKNTYKDPVSVALAAQNEGAGEIFINAIHKDGTWEGYDLNLIKLISKSTSLPVIACGGAGKIKDFHKAVYESGASAVAAGSMFVFQKKGMGVLINFPKENKNI